MSLLVEEGEIREHALSVGFSDVACLDVEEVEEDFLHFYLQYLAQGMHASMRYLERVDRKVHPHFLLPDVGQIIVFLHPYRNRSVDNLYFQYDPRLAYYAWGQDYHVVLKESMQKTVSTYFPKQNYRLIVDSTPLPERYWARRTGLGFIGKNAHFIHHAQGSFLFLSFALLKGRQIQTKENRLRGSIQKDIDRYCGECTCCLEVCPGKALLGNGVLDAKRCVSYITTQKKDGESSPLIGEHPYLYGCDLCQIVCPYNKWKVFSLLPEFEPNPEKINSLLKQQRRV